MHACVALRTFVALMLTAFAVTGAPQRTSASPHARSATYRVCASGCDFTTIQAAINAAADGDAIEVAAGVYSENITIAKSLHIRGGYVASPAWAPGPAGSRSTVRGDKSRSVIQITSPDATPRNASLSRLLIENGQAQTGGGVDARNINLAVSDSIIARNTVTPSAMINRTYGAGIFAERGALRVSASHFESNANCPLLVGCRTASGGGIHVSATISAAIESSTFLSNSAWAGAGVSAQDTTLEVISSTFRSPEYPARYGFGVFANRGDSARVSGNRFEQYRFGANGGAVNMTNLRDITFSANQVGNVTGDGCAVQLGAQHARVVNNVLSGIENNFRDDGILLLTVNDLLLAHNTLANNRVVSEAVPMITVYSITSTVIANNLLTGAPLGVRMIGGAPVTLTHNLMHAVAVPYTGPAPVVSNTLLTANPGFVNATTDLRITADSPARDAGVAQPGIVTDISGVPRDASPDIGAYEYDPLNPPAPLRKTFLPNLSKR